MSGKTYKAVFTCKETNERIVWYVSSRHEAQRMASQHTKSAGNKNKLHKQYRDATMRLVITPMFLNEGEAGYDSDFFGWAGH